MKKMWMLLFASFLMSGAALAQNTDQGPSYQETVDWILSKQNQLGSVTENNLGMHKVRYNNLALPNCTVQFDEISEDMPPNPYSSDMRFHVTIPLNATIRVSVLDNKNAIRFDADTDSIHRQGAYVQSRTNRNLDQNSRAYVWLVQMPDTDHADIAARMAKALNHLAQLCGEPASKEPF
jgi:hypothetical protein